MAARVLEQAAGCSCIEMVMNDGRVARSVHQQWIDMFYRGCYRLRNRCCYQAPTIHLAACRERYQYIIVL